MNADRIFLDANILFSIAFGSPGLNRLWELAQRKRCVLFASNFVVEEAKRNLFSSEQLRNLEAFLSMVQLVPDVDPNIPCPIKLPEEDRPVLLVTISIKADYLLTGDMIHFGKYFGQTVRGNNAFRYYNFLLLVLLINDHNPSVVKNSLTTLLFLG